MSIALTSRTTGDAGFVCECEEEMRAACVAEPFYEEREGKRYCVLHFPDAEKNSEVFEQAVRRKLENSSFNFQGVWFGANADFGGISFSVDANFNGAVFRSVDFSGATFKANANFDSVEFNEDASFSKAKFGAGADFSQAAFIKKGAFNEATFDANVTFWYATFEEADFWRAVFNAKAFFWKVEFTKEADFREATFIGQANFGLATFISDANFRQAIFRGEAYFRQTTFKATAKFRDATFENYVKFASGNDILVFAADSSLDLQFARIDKPDRVSFHTLALRRHWFVNVDARKFDFANVKWDWDTTDKEVESLLKSEEISSPSRLLAITYRNLAVNTEENNRYTEASTFRYMAMDVERRELARGFGVWKLRWWYWLASGYGERVLQAAIVLLGVWVLFAFVFYFGQRSGQWWKPSPASVQESTQTKESRLCGFGEALIYSAGVMTLQKPEPLPANKRAKSFVLLETILGPVQGALLALAIRRKFMR